MDTEYAAPERASEIDLASDIEDIKEITLVQELTQLISDAFVILNIHRQIVYCNPAVVRILRLSAPEQIYGLRPGEALNCIHAKELARGGCGTSRFCRYCGAVNAIIDSQDTPGEVKINECRLTGGDKKQSFDFNIRAKTLSLLDRHFTLLIIQDISAEKRRTVLERMFFHDILNTAGGVQGLIELMQEASPEELEEFLTLAASSTDTLVEEIHAQRDILAAEEGRLEIEAREMNAMDILSKVHSIYKTHPEAEGKKLRISLTAVSETLTGDPRLLTRIIGNMVKNALEAEPQGEVITMGADSQDGHIEFWVHNSSVMTDEVRLQIFQRSFSTRGNARGMGTYSMRLLGEQFLKGKVKFTSEPATGTRFYIRLRV
jgi:hypothetical protein